MEDQEVWNQAMLERQEILEGALLRAQSGSATDKDWDLIWWECGFYERRKQLKGSENVNC
jgi:hypothetical protein